MLAVRVASGLQGGTAVSPYSDARPDQASLISALANYAQPNDRASGLQLAGAIVLFVGCWAAAYLALRVSLLLGLALTLPAAGLMIRIFVLQHDCGHGALFRSARANTVAGTLCSVFTFTPFAHWRRQHARHHGSWNNLDRRRSGLDIYSDCRTVREYRQLSPMRRLAYRLMRHPIVAHLIIPPMIFLLLYRTPFDTPKGWRRERRSVHVTNLAILAQAVCIGGLLGFGSVAIIELTTLLMASIGGVWLFALQHKFEGVNWVRQPEWNLTAASLTGASCLRLPAVLQWFTGNIGFHHIHHLNPRVPNYRLQEAYEALPRLRAATTLGLLGGLRAVGYVLWDETQAKLVRFRDVAAA
ncbi:MAG TPA: fatty acid desaturase [Candidatus Sulfotelmatobacter sp.]|nr:fatty acid desaturase [Candidatus Sulfotelmatobacter sp.]